MSRNTPLIAPREDWVTNLRMNKRLKINSIRAKLNIIENYLNSEPEPFQSATPDWAETNFLQYDEASGLGHAEAWLDEVIDNQRQVRVRHQRWNDPPTDPEATARLRKRW